MEQHPPDESGGITRRQALVLGVAGAGAVVVGATGLIVSGLTRPDTTDAGGSGEATEPGSARTGWVEPAVLESQDGVLDLGLEVAETEVAIAGGVARMMTYNGTVPGPTLHLRPGDRLRVRLRNGLGEPTNLHTHGLGVSAEGNGDNPFVRIGSGEEFEYDIDLPGDHPHGVFWYHPHHHGTVADQLFAGLSGAIVVDEDDWGLAAPRIAVVSDVTIASGAVSGVSGIERMLGRTGETLLVNGLVAPALRAPAGADQRVLLINACSSRYLDLGLAGLDARVRGIDGGHLPDVAADRILLAPGNRADLVLTTPEAAVEVIAAAHDRGAAGMGMMGGRSAGSPEALLLTVEPDAAATAPVVAEASAETHPDLREVAIDGTRTVTLDMGMGGGAGMRFLIDGRGFDPDRVDLTVDVGVVEEWTIVNTSPMDHPFHLHVWPMQVVRAGGADTSGMDVRDVVDVPAGESVTVRIAFDRFPGRTVYHCHILDHEDLGMMGVIESG